MSERTVGYIGLDHHHAEPYLQTLNELPVSVTSACEPNPQFDTSTVPSLGDIPVYNDVESLLAATSLDVVFMTLPNRDTPTAIEQALDAGVDIYTEKPAARTAAELEPVLARVEKSDATVGVSYPWQSHPIAQELTSLVDDGFFGDLRAFNTRFIASQLAYRKTDHFIFDKAASRGGILQWLGIHWIQLLTQVLDEPISRVNANMVADNDTGDVEDGAILQLETVNGAIGTLQCGYYLGEGFYDTKFDIYGNDGRSSWDPIGREFGFDGMTTLELDDTSGEWASTPHRTITYDYDSEPGYGGAWGNAFVRSFFDACDDESKPPVTLKDALIVLRILDAAYESDETDDWVTVMT